MALLSSLKRAHWILDPPSLVFKGYARFLSEVKRPGLEANQSSTLLPYSMEQGPSSVANRFSASKEIPLTLWNPKVHNHVDKCLTPVPTLIHINPVHALQHTSYRYILILFSHLRLGLPSGFFPSGFRTKTLYVPFLSPTRATCPSLIIHVVLITRIILGEEYTLLSSSRCNFLHSLVTSSFLGPNNLLCTLFSRSTTE
jgi:hypothetical protein